MCTAMRRKRHAAHRAVREVSVNLMQPPPPFVAWDAGASAPTMRCGAGSHPPGQAEGRASALEVRVQELTDELMAVVVLAAEHAIDSVREGGPLVPFVLSESAQGTRRLQRILIGSPVDLTTSVARARALA